MPIRPVTGKLQLPVETPADAQTLFEAGLKIARESKLRPLTAPQEARDLADHFFYLGAVHPEFARPLQPELVRLLDEQLKGFSLTFSEWLYLLQGADAGCVEHLAAHLDRTPNDWQRQWMLAAIGTPAAMTAIAAFVRKHGFADKFADIGFHVPSDGQPAQARFTPWRRAIRVFPFAGEPGELMRATHPIGLPLAAIADDPEDRHIRWHYLSLQTAALEGIPALGVERLHLVSPAANIDWTLLCDVATDGKYRFRGQEPDEEDWLAESADDNDTAPGRATAELLPYDDRLTYCNGHTQSTEGVEGDVGGPPLGVYPNPKCPNCGRLMFHVLTATCYVREYGDGFRSLFLCEDCRITACTATGWN